MSTKRKPKAYHVTFADGTQAIMDDDGVASISMKGQGYSIIDFDTYTPSNF